MKRLKDLKYFAIDYSYESTCFFLIPKSNNILVGDFLKLKDELEFCETFILTMNENIRKYE